MEEIIAKTIDHWRWLRPLFASGHEKIPHCPLCSEAESRMEALFDDGFIPEEVGDAAEELVEDRYNKQCLFCRFFETFGQHCFREFSLVERTYSTDSIDARVAYCDQVIHFLEEWGGQVSDGQ